MNLSYARMATAEVLEIDGETLILNPDTFAVTKLNETAGRIWEMLEERPSVDQLTERVSSEFAGADRQSVRQDIVQFLGRLEEIGLVRRG